MPTTVTITGFKEFEAKLKNLPKELFGEVDGEVEEASKMWQYLADRAAPKDFSTPGLAGSIKNGKVKEMEWEVTANAEYAAFMEWGTKSKVRVPADLQAYAAQFRGAKTVSIGKVKDLIYAWCSRHNIPQEAWYLVYRSIMRYGVNPHPFFFIQTPLVEKELVSRVKKILNTEH